MDHRDARDACRGRRAPSGPDRHRRDAHIPIPTRRVPRVRKSPRHLAALARTHSSPRCVETAVSNLRCFVFRCGGPRACTAPARATRMANSRCRHGAGHDLHRLPAAVGPARLLVRHGWSQNISGYRRILFHHNIKYVLLGNNEVGPSTLARWVWVHAAALTFILVVLLIVIAIQTRTPKSRCNRLAPSDR
jgi:hypothetical protein